MLHIRPAQEHDLDTVLEIQREAFGAYAGVYEVSAWTTETLESVRGDLAEKRVLVGEWQGHIVGSVRFWTVAGVCVIRLLSVRPAYQGRGVAKALMREIERLSPEAHKFYVCTMLRTARNIGLFLNLGYRPEAVLPSHYHKLDLLCLAKYHERRAEA